MAYTMVISLVLSLKFLSPMLTAGLVGTLAIAKIEISRNDFWALVVVVVGTRMSSLVVDGVAGEDET
jgi:hypothetical protein